MTSDYRTPSPAQRVHEGHRVEHLERIAEALDKLGTEARRIARVAECLETEIRRELKCNG